MERDRKRIGVVGGMGPYAGLDLVRKIFDQTIASTDQEHLDVLLLSTPRIPDRTAFLLRGSGDHPALLIAAALRTLERAGAAVAGIPCNTAHAPVIFDAVLEDLHKGANTIRILSIITEMISFLKQRMPSARRIGVLATTGTLRTRVYTKALVAQGFSVIEPDERVQDDLVHRAIYDKTYGIKAHANPVTAKAKEDVESAIAHLALRGADVVVLGCTELSLLLDASFASGLPMIDPTVVLARALIRETEPEKLRPL